MSPPTPLVAAFDSDASTKRAELASSAELAFSASASASGSVRVDQCRSSMIRSLHALGLVDATWCGVPREVREKAAVAFRTGDADDYRIAMQAALACDDLRYFRAMPAKPPRIA